MVPELNVMHCELSTIPQSKSTGISVFFFFFFFFRNEGFFQRKLCPKTPLDTARAKDMWK